MMKKKNLILTIIAVLIVAILIAKIKLDDYAENKIQEAFDRELIEALTGFNVDFKEINVNTFGGEVTIEELELVSGDEATIYLEEFTVGSSYKDLKNLKNGGLENLLEKGISSIDLNFKNLKIEYEMWDYYSDDLNTVNLNFADNIEISYNGGLTQYDLDKLLNGELPKTDHTISLDITGFNLQDFYNQMYDEIEYDYGFEKMDFGIEFGLLGSTENIEINTSHKTEYGDGDMSFTAKYNGELDDDFDFEKIEIKAQSKANYNNLKSSISNPGNSNEKIEMTLNKVFGKLNFSYKGDVMGLDYMDEEDAIDMVLDNMQLDYSANVEDISIKLPKSLINEIKYDVPSLKLKNRTFDLTKFKTDLEYNDNQIIADIDLINSLFSIDGECKVNITNTEEFEIDQLKIAIGDFWDEDMLAGFIDEVFGFGTYEVLPKNDNSVIINISGSSDEPKIELQDGSKSMLFEPRVNASSLAIEACECLQLEGNRSKRREFDECYDKIDHIVTILESNDEWMDEFQDKVIDCLEQYN